MCNRMLKYVKIIEMQEMKMREGVKKDTSLSVLSDKFIY